VAADIAAPARTAVRFERLDALRGVAIVWMVVFHFCFDLNHFRFISQNFYHDPVWTWQRSCIVSLFLFCAGLGQAVAWSQGQGWPRFWRRWGQVAGCALLVTAGSYLIFPKSYITFGVLHGIAVMLIVVRLTSNAGRWLWLMGAVALLLPHVARDAWFNAPGPHFIGLVTHKPVTEDWVPLLPWIGIMWWGMAAGQWVLGQRRVWLEGSVPAAARPLALLGRWSLSIYMLHQPLFFGLLSAVVWARSNF
jgi:uncharacterized membrane protein